MRYTSFPALTHRRHRGVCPPLTSGSTGKAGRPQAHSSPAPDVAGQCATLPAPVTVCVMP